VSPTVPAVGATAGNSPAAKEGGVAQEDCAGSETSAVEQLRIVDDNEASTPVTTLEGTQTQAEAPYAKVPDNATSAVLFPLETPMESTVNPLVEGVDGGTQALGGSSHEPSDTQPNTDAPLVDQGKAPGSCFSCLLRQKTSWEEVEADYHLSWRKAKQLRKAFRAIDENGNGSISKEELIVGMLAHTGAFLSDGDAAAAVALSDTNKDGLISYAEFISWLVTVSKRTDENNGHDPLIRLARRMGYEDEAADLTNRMWEDE